MKNDESNWRSMEVDESRWNWWQSVKLMKVNENGWIIRWIRIFSGETTSGTMAIADLDGDGFFEIVSAGYTAGKVYVHTFAPEKWDLSCS